MARLFLLHCGDKWYVVSVSSTTGSILGMPVDCMAFICGEGAPNDIIC